MEEGFLVTPLPASPSAQFVAATLPASVSLDAPCEECGHVGDNMICLGDNRILCGRLVQQHAMRHCTREGMRCKLAMSFLDLSVWDYEQDAYLDAFSIVDLRPHFSMLHEAKFGRPADFPASSSSSAAADSGVTLELFVASDDAPPSSSPPKGLDGAPTDL